MILDQQARTAVDGASFNPWLKHTSARIVTLARNVVIDQLVVVATIINSRLVSEAGCSVAAVVGELGVGDRIIDHLVVRGRGRRHCAGRIVIGQRHAHVVAIGRITAPDDILHDPHSGGSLVPAAPENQDACRRGTVGAGVRMPGDLVAHDHSVAAEADLDPVLRDVDDRPVSRDRISADRNRGIRPVRDDPAFLIEVDGIAGDCTGRARAIVERVVINPNAVLRAVKRLLADIVDLVAGVSTDVVPIFPTESSPVTTMPK